MPSVRYQSWGFLLLLLALPAVAAQQPAPPENNPLREALLVEQPEPDRILELLSQPELLAERRIQATLLRLLRSADDPVFSAAATVCLTTPQLDGTAPMLWRRCEALFLRANPRQKSLLEMAARREDLRHDRRVVALIAEALLEKDTELSRLALGLVEQDPSLNRHLGIAHALQSVHGRPADRSFPDPSIFEERIAPALTSPGGDGQACFDCHQGRTIFHLTPPQEMPDRQASLRQLYRATLHVIDPEQPEQSWILVKPVQPPPEPRQPASLKTHTGGARFEVDSATYRQILEWIRSARPSER